MGGDILPSSGNKFTGSKYVVAGIGLITYKNTNNTVPTIRQNGQFISINPSPTPTPSFTPTNTPTPTITPTPTPSPPPVPPQTFTFNASSVESLTLGIVFDSLSFSSGGYVDWGDGSTTSITIPSLNTFSHTYGSPYTGEIVIYYYGSFTYFNISQATPGSSSVLVFDTLEFTQHTQLDQLFVSWGRLVGQFSDFNTTNLTELTVKNDYTSSALNDLPLTLESLTLGSGGYTIISGDISELSTYPITTISLHGTNTVSGDLSTLPSSLIALSIQGSNTVSGDIAYFNFPNLTSMSINGSNTVTGVLSDLPANLTALTVGGNNTLYGNLSDIPISINTLSISPTGGGGGGLITGDLSDLPRDGYSSLQLVGTNHSISANTATIPVVSGSTFNVRINGTLTGDLSDIFNSGADFPSCIFNLSASQAMSTNLTYTSSTFPWNLFTIWTFSITTITDLTSSEIDNLLIDIDNYSGGLNWGSCGSASNSITLNGTRTSVSDSAVASLNSKGVTVTVS